MFYNGFSSCWSGAFEDVRMCKTNFLWVTYAHKTIKGTMADLRAEALVLHHLSGNEIVPYFYGMLASSTFLEQKMTILPL